MLGNKKYIIRRRMKTKKSSDDAANADVGPRRSQILQHIDAQTMGNESPTTAPRRSRMILQHMDEQITAGGSTSLVPITSTSPSGDPKKKSQGQQEEEKPAAALTTNKKSIEASQCRAIPIRKLSTQSDPSSSGPSSKLSRSLSSRNAMTLPDHILLANTDKTTEGSSLDDDSKTVQSCPPPAQTKPRKKRISLCANKHTTMDVAKTPCSLNASPGDLPTIKSSPVAAPSKKELKRGTTQASHTVMANTSSAEAKCSRNDDDDRPSSSSRSGRTRSELKLEVDVMRENFTGAGHYANNLVMVNRERAKECVRPLTRSVTLDETASTFAKQMAKSSGSQQIHTHLSVNMMRGPSVRAIHAAFMSRDRERDNIVNADSKEFGMGTAKGEDGQLYLCQLFGSERVLLTCLDYK
jgi:uncharacterized protein YkwD